MIPRVEPRVTAEVLALGAEGSILKLGMNVTVVNCDYYNGIFNGSTAMVSGIPTYLTGSGRWQVTILVPAVDKSASIRGLKYGELRNFPPECLKPILDVSAPPKRTTDYDPF